MLSPRNDITVAVWLPTYFEDEKKSLISLLMCDGAIKFRVDNELKELH